MIKSTLSKYFVCKYADSGPVPGLYNASEFGYSSIHELCDKNYFSLDLPQPSVKYINSLPAIQDVLPLFQRPLHQSPELRVSLMLPFMAQHLTDAIFQSKNNYETNAPHEIVLNQIYGNNKVDTGYLRSHNCGKLKSQRVNNAEFPPALCEKDKQGDWQIKKEFKKLSYLYLHKKNIENTEKINTLLASYQGREQTICATGLFQGNLTLGNFSLSTLLLREHNRLCDEIKDEYQQQNKPTDDQSIFRTAVAVNILTYMRIVVEDYINAFSGINLFELDLKSFFYETKRWCRASPIPFHFNVLYRLHAMIPNQLNILQEQGFHAFLANNNQVMEVGLGEILSAASKQAASSVQLGNTHSDLMSAEQAMLVKSRSVLSSFATYRQLEKLSNKKGFDMFAPHHRDKLKKLYKGDFNKVDYAVGIYAEQPNHSIKEKTLTKLGIKKQGFLGDTLMASIAKHAFRHIFSNPLMRKEFLNSNVLSKVGWDTLETTHNIQDLVIRNVPELSSQAKNLTISMHM